MSTLIFRKSDHAYQGVFVTRRHEFNLDWVIGENNGERFKILASQVYMASAPGDVAAWLDAEIEREMLA